MRKWALACVTEIVAEGQRLFVISLQGNTVVGTLLAVVSDVRIRRWVVQSFNSMVMSK